MSARNAITDFSNIYMPSHHPTKRLAKDELNKANHGLPRRMAPINPQITPGHKTTRIADQEHRGPAVLLRHAQFAQHILRRPVAPALGELLEQRLHHPRHDVARRDGVDADAVVTPFGGEVAAELDDAGFGGVVSGADKALWCG